MSQQTRTDALVAFQRRSIALGNNIAPGANWRTDLCASLAGSFAVAINNGIRLRPEHRLSNKECALLWIGVVATDAAVKRIGESYERALLSMPIWLLEASAIEQVLMLSERCKKYTIASS